MKIIEVTATPFLKEREGRLAQRFQVAIENDGESAPCIVQVETPESRNEFLLDPLPPGSSTHDVLVEEVAQPTRVTFHLVAAGKSVCETSVDAVPPKHWRVHVVQTSHHDVGYTDLASRVLPQHAAYLDAAIDMAEATRDFPDDARFRIVIETAWSLLEFLRRAPSDRAGKMMALLRSGQIELAALFGNMTTELSGHESLFRVIYPAFRLKREYGIPLVTAEHNDIPGISWGLCRVLADAGIRYFCPGLPLYYDWSKEGLPSFWNEEAVFGRKGPGAFWWESPTGKRVLFWCNNSGCGGECKPELPGLARKLEELVRADYAYDVLRWPVLGAARDNSPYIEGYAHTIRAWNEQWAYPHLICSTNARFFDEFAAQAGTDLPVHRGELPGQDYPVGAMSTALETVENRANHVRMPCAETLATAAAHWTDLHYPRASIDQAYEDILWHDEHTWGFHFPASGPAARASQFEKGVHAHRAAALAHDVASKALARIADGIRRDKPGLYLVVFNPLAAPRTGLVSAPLREPDNCGSEIVPVTSEDGTTYLRGVVLNDRWHVNPSVDIAEGKFDLIDVSTEKTIPYQIREITDAMDVVPCAAERFGLSQGGKRYGLFEIPLGLRRDVQFIAEDVPAIGYRTYLLAPRKKPHRGIVVRKTRRTALENEYYRVEMDEGFRRVVQIRDKELGRDLLDPSAPHGFGEIIVRDPTLDGERRTKPLAPAIIRRGPLSMELSWDAAGPGLPHVRHTLTLYRGIKRIDVAVRALKDPTPLLDVHLAFPFEIESPRFRYESALTVMEPIADYLPGSQSDRIAVQNWVKVGGATHTILWSSLDSPTVSLGRLWPGYVSPAHRCVRGDDRVHVPLTPRDLAHGWIYSTLFNNNFQTNFAVSQCCSVLFRYTIASHEGSVSDADAARFGWNAVTPMESIFTDRMHEPLLPLSTSFVAVRAPEVVVLACKRAEDGHGIILRLWNVSYRTITTEIDLPYIVIEHVERVTCAEEAGETLGHRARGFSVQLAAQEIMTLRVS